MNDRGAPPGSLRYFAVLFAPAAVRPQLEALYSFEAEIRDTVAAAHEVAHTRLQWWRGEIDRLAAGHPGHPVTVTMLPLREHAGFDPLLLHEMLVAADLDLARFTWQDWRELDAYCLRASGALQTLLAAALVGHRNLATSERAFARRLGSALRQTEMLRDFFVDLTMGRLRLPVDALAAAGIDPAAVQQSPGNPALRDVLEQWRSRVRAEFESLPAALADPAERAGQRHGLVLGALHERLLARIEWNDTRGVQRTELAPLTRLWTAWRTALLHG